MATPIVVNGVRSSDLLLQGNPSETIASLSQRFGGAWALFCGDSIHLIPGSTTFYLAKYVVVLGGTYTLKVVGDNTVTLKIDGVAVGSALELDKPIEFTVTLTAGVHRLDVIHYNDLLEDNPAWLMYSFYRGTDNLPEFYSTVEDWTVSLAGEPELGDPPYPTVDMNLPPWLPKPNWKDGVTETIAWLTDVMISESGAEQRRKIRRNPRRTVEASFLVTDNDRQILDISLAAIGRGVSLVPIYWDKHHPGSPITEGDTLIAGDFSNQYNFYGGGLALIQGQETLDHEVILVQGADGAGLSLTFPTQKSWGTCADIYPLSRARLTDVGTIDAHTHRVAGYQIRWELLDPITVPGSWGDRPINARTNLPVLIRPLHNWKESAQFELNRNVFIHDNQTGISDYTDVGGNSTQLRRLNVLIQGRQAYREIVQLLHAMAGRHQTFHMPTAMDEVTLIADIDENQGALIIERSGYTLFDAVRQDIRQWVMVELVNGTRHFTRVISNRILGNEEWLFTEQTFGNIPRAQVRRIDWIPVSRLASDTIEIQHHTDLDGVAEVTLPIHSFYDRRNAQPI